MKSSSVSIRPMESSIEISSTRLTDEQKASFRLWLQRQFTERCKRNSRYSLRAFAKLLLVDHSSLSQILSGKRPISKNTMAAFCTKLSTTPADLRSFGLIDSKGIEEDYLQLDVDAFSAISDWYHAAI